MVERSVQSLGAPRRPINHSYVTLLDRSRERPVAKQLSQNEQRQQMREQLRADYYAHSTYSPPPERGKGMLVLSLMLLTVVVLLCLVWL